MQHELSTRPAFNTKLKAALDKLDYTTSERRRQLIQRYRHKNILVKAAGDGLTVTIPGNCVLADDLIVHQLTTCAVTKYYQQWVDEQFDIALEYGPTLYQIHHDFNLDDLVDLRQHGLGRTIMGSIGIGNNLQQIDPKIIQDWLTTHNTHGIPPHILARQLKPGAIGTGLVDPEFLINIPCRMNPIATLINHNDNPQIGEIHLYHLN